MHIAWYKVYTTIGNKIGRNRNEIYYRCCTVAVKLHKYIFFFIKEVCIYSSIQDKKLLYIKTQNSIITFT